MSPQTLLFIPAELLGRGGHQPHEGARPRGPERRYAAAVVLLSVLCATLAATLAV